MSVGQALEIDEAGSVSWMKTREYLEKKPVLATLWVIISVGTPFLGLILAGWPGIVVGLGVAVVCAVVGLHAVTKVREIEKGGG